MRSFQSFIVLGAIGLGILATSCDHLIGSKVEIPELCKTFPDQTFPGAGGLGQVLDPTPITVHGEFTFDVGTEIPKLNDEHNDSKVTFLKAEIIKKSGAEDLKFLHAVKLTLASGVEGSTLPDQLVVDYTGDPATHGDKLELAGINDNNLTPYVDERFVKIKTSLTGVIPKEGATVDIRLCFYGEHEYAK